MADTDARPGVNGHPAPERLDGRVPFTPFDPAAGTDTTDAIAPGDPVLDGEGGITAGNDTTPETLSPVEGHEVLIRPERGRRWQALRDADVQVPAALHDREALKTVAAREGRAVRNAAKLALKHGPWATVKALWWTLRGYGKALWAVGGFLFVRELHPELSTTPATSDKGAVSMDFRRARRQKVNLYVVLFALVAVLVAGAWLYMAVGTWPLWLALVAVSVCMYRLGRPAGKRAFLPTGTPQLRPRLTLERIVSAFGVLGISGINDSIKAGTTDRWWTSTPQAVKGGHVVDMHLPAGIEARSIVQWEQRLAGALGRAEDTVIVEPMPQRTPSDLRLWVFDVPQLERAGAGPLATARKTSWFEPVQIGVTRSGRPHREHLRGGAWFIGGRPGAGKSSAAFCAGAHTVLDPTARLMIAALKGPVDWPVFEKVTERYIIGAPETNRDVIPQALALLRWLLDEAGRRNDFLDELRRKGVQGTNQVSRDLASKYPDRLGPITAIFDEVHRLFDESDNPDAKETAELVGKVIKAVRSAGICLVLVTQLAGSEAVPPVVVRAARLRGCMRVGDEISFRQIFGNAGKGMFHQTGAGRLKTGQIILATDAGDPVKVGVHYLEPYLERICERARVVHEAMGALRGHAAGDDTPLPAALDPTTLLRDVLDAIPGTAPTGGPDDAGVAWVADLEVTLTELEAYRDRSPGWLAGELRARKVATGQLNRRVPAEVRASGQRNETGVRAVDVRDGLARLLGVAE